MIASLGFVALYVVLIAVASFIEVPLAKGFGSVQLNLLIRAGSLSAAIVAMVVVHGASIPHDQAALAGLGIGVLTGVGSIIYCLALIDMPISLVVTLANLYLVITTVLGVVVLHESFTVMKVAGLACIICGVVFLATPPSSRYGVHSAMSIAKRPPPLRGFLVMAAYIVIVGVGAFLEKPALRGVDPTQLNGLMALSMTAVAAGALVIERPQVQISERSLGPLAVGAVIGLASVFYFLGLRGLPVSVAAGSSNASVVITVLLSTVLLRQRLTLG